MGFDKVARYLPEFPVRDKLIYLNHAAVAPLSRRSAEAMKGLADDALYFGSLHYDRWLAAYQGVRDAAAELINCTPAEIALVKNTSEGIATVAMGLDWREGDKIVCFREEFPANFLPWKKLERKGARVEWLSIADPLDRVDEACRGARLLTVSFVQYLSGFRANIEAMGEICSRRGCLFFVDAIQGMGAFPLDASGAGIHALAADGHKWMLGPEGCGVLYVAREVQDDIEPVEFGWTNVATYTDYAARELALRPDAGRYECGTLNPIGCFGLQAALRLLLEIGVENIGPVVQDLGDRLAQGAERKGYEVLGPQRTPATGAGIVCIRKEGIDSRTLTASLREAGIVAAPRQGWVRLSPHFYITAEDIDRTLSRLP